ncbi:Ubiquitin carboxyl-terminal hydrolase 3 [Collichthys lucidus]|uniref:Ubiquitin carboxyl-terminal hydrolase n=1 Tax=Collichthys lucidus TaxID=240159 RepID=A0A4U5UFK2_COLLU|nr:Ubiquitin carboxyl-terminal hydrolase 3 [Collichthys lucidus]
MKRLLVLGIAFVAFNASHSYTPDDRNEEEEEEPDTPIAIICGVLIAVIIASIFITIIVLTVKSKKKGSKKDKKAGGKNKDPKYVSGHAKKHFEESQVVVPSQKKGEKQEKEKSHHSVCMDCSNYSVFCSALMGDRQRKRRLQDSPAPDSKLLKDNDGVALGATGLRNLGNTCFMNAILQSLSNIEQFSCYFKELPAVALRSGKTAGRRMYHTRSQGDNSVSLVEEFRKTLCSLWQGSQTAFSPDSLFYAIWKIMPSFRGYQQQDAHEFMRYLLDHLHRELQYSRNGASHPVSPQDGVRLSTAEGKCCINGTASVVTSIFGGILQNEVNCLICGTESRKFDPFLDLSLDIPSQFRQKRSKDQEPGPTCTLRDCLRSFTDLEELDETELYYCHKCKKRQKSTKKFWVQKLPKVLCLHLKRFHWTAFLRNKVDTYVEFPLKGLDMRGYLLEPENSLPESCLYDLVAVVVHHGSGVGSGHYTAYGSHEGRWYHFNDSTVTLTNEDAVRKAKAYILFYVERTERVASDKTATNSTATNRPAVDAAAMDSVSSEVVAQDKSAADVVLMDVAVPDSAALENEGEDMAELHSADTASMEAVSDGDTSDKAATEEASQAIQAAAQ